MTLTNGLSRGGHSNGEYRHHQLHRGQLSSPVDERHYFLFGFLEPECFR